MCSIAQSGSYKRRKGAAAPWPSCPRTRARVRFSEGAVASRHPNRECSALSTCLTPSDLPPPRRSPTRRPPPLVRPCARHLVHGTPLHTHPVPAHTGRRLSDHRLFDGVIIKHTVVSFRCVQTLQSASTIANRYRCFCKCRSARVVRSVWRPCVVCAGNPMSPSPPWWPQQAVLSGPRPTRFRSAAGGTVVAEPVERTTATVTSLRGRSHVVELFAIAPCTPPWQRLPSDHRRRYRHETEKKERRAATVYHGRTAAAAVMQRRRTDEETEKVRSETYGDRWQLQGSREVQQEQAPRAVQRESECVLRIRLRDCHPGRWLRFRRGGLRLLVTTAVQLRWRVVFPAVAGRRRRRPRPAAARPVRRAAWHAQSAGRLQGRLSEARTATAVVFGPSQIR